MPRRRPQGQNNSSCIKRRVRTGCKTCRTRRVKCDESKPRCQNCLQRDLACDNSVQLKWEQEFERRGLAFGRQGRWTKSRTPPSGTTTEPMVADPAMEWCSFPLVQFHHFINFCYGDYDDVDADQECDVDIEGTSDDSVVGARTARQIFPSPSVNPNLANIDAHLLEYYLTRLCPLTTSSRHAPSPFAQLVVPLFSMPGQEDILQAILALSARHRSVSDPQWSRSAMTLKGGVITSLRNRLLIAGSPDSTWDPQILVIMMFLCLYEIVDNCDHRWVIHLRASKEVIRRSRQLEEARRRKAGLGALTEFTERFFAFQDVISRTACGNSALFGVEYWDEGSQPEAIDSWMGCSPSLVSILCHTVEISRLKTQDHIPRDILETESAELELRLETMRLRADSSHIDNTLVLAAELKRKSVLLYHHCVLYDAGPSTPFVCQLKREILEETCELVEAGFAAGLAFPIFVAAVELHPTDEQLFCDRKNGQLLSGRRLVLETLEAMEKLSLSNIARTRSVIQKVWRMRDMSLEEDYQSPLSPGGYINNDWSIFVGPYSSNISLS
jgi:Fungal specific transcription factor domain/Fungal Zn(2)-Cys(6) binuclear cluster domain